MPPTVAEHYEAEQKKERERIVKNTAQNYDTAKKEYDAIAPFYQQSFQHHAGDICPFIKFADIQPGQKVLELGCGAGWVTAQAASQVGPEGCVVAIDASGGCLRQASITATLRGLQNIQFLKGDMHDLKQFPRLQSLEFKTFDRILLLWVIVDHEHREFACLDALPFDGTDPDELHLLIGDGRSFKEARKFAKSMVKEAGLEVVAMDDCYRDGRYKDCAAEIRAEANIAWQKDGGTGKECSRLYLEFFKRREVTNIMETRRK
ncbi:uncharacterized protein BDCG_07595 [Blastomyces dermatitidis ER-3]|uniref:Methyltransferase domain-containing protein n=1 Tax=Ajellomyces dermatitidis (strain ER-3 / ATCC MYA-2586) TaxID=559297 RepID=A0ABP2F5W5_AJEDR|nr:uncharacterized protein BDCG_07595 [Blastomyces dermatitidis ER-3]EEQ92475.1 hypothetical protein BDCG_07595 [Blastomyces dermatitidis ER-3]